LSEGVEVGTSVGTKVGDSDGAVVGENVGLGVGKYVILGFLVGLNVGAGVGFHVGVGSYSSSHVVLLVNLIEHNSCLHVAPLESSQHISISSLNSSQSYEHTVLAPEHDIFASRHDL
jgi:hypothetical protein